MYLSANFTHLFGLSLTFSCLQLSLLCCITYWCIAALIPCPLQGLKQICTPFSRAFTVIILVSARTLNVAVFHFLVYCLTSHLSFPLHTFPTFLNQPNFIDSFLTFVIISGTFHVQALNYTPPLWTAWIFIPPNPLVMLCIAQFVLRWHEHTRTHLPVNISMLKVYSS